MMAFPKQNPPLATGHVYFNCTPKPAPWYIRLLRKLHILRTPPRRVYIGRVTDIVIDTTEAA